MIRHYCDKFGKEITKDGDSKFIEITSMPFGRPVFTDYSFELCNDCLEGMAEYLCTEIRFDETTDVNKS